MQSRVIHLLPILLFCAIILVSIQPINGQKRENKVTDGAAIEISTLELRLTMDAFFSRFSRTVAQAADSIISLSANDQEQVNQALFWKMNAIPVAQEAIFGTDAFAAFIDVTVFCYQMKQFFIVGDGKALFGDNQQIAIRASETLWMELIEIGRKLTPDKDITDGLKLLTDFGDEHPINSLYFNRVSTLPLQASVKEAEKLGFKSLAQGMARSVDELSSRINAYTEILPKQIRWQSEYMLNNMLNSPQLTQRLDTLTQLMERAVVLAEGSPDLIDEQRVATMRDLRNERIAVMNAITREREALMEALRQEREIIMQQVDESITKQREASFEQLDAIAEKNLNMAFSQTKKIMNLLYWRTAVLLSILLVSLFLGMLIYKRL